jgi:hypothetical protein
MAVKFGLNTLLEVVVCNLYDGYETSDNRFVVVGSSLEDSPPPKPDGIIRILDTNGDLQNYETYGGTLSDYFRGVCPTTDNNGSVMVGTTLLPINTQ